MKMPEGKLRKTDTKDRYKKTDTERSPNMNDDKKTNGQEVDDIINMLDHMVESGVGRIKVKTSEELAEGSVKKEYHHGRCDINSPFACGQSFDTEEDKRP